MSVHTQIFPIPLLLSNLNLKCDVSISLLVHYTAMSHESRGRMSLILMKRLSLLLPELIAGQ